MEHPQIDDEKILDRYLARQLSPEDEALFEEHLFECAECLEQVQWGEEMRRGLKGVAAQEATRAAVARGVLSLGLAAWLRKRAVALSSLAALLIVLLSSAVLWQRSELNALRASGGAASFTAPMSDFLVVSLGVVRDGAGEAMEVRPDPEREALLLSLELQVVTADRYRVTLRDAAGEALWSGEGLEPNLYDTLLIALPSSYLAPGSYRITVEALSEAGAEPAGELQFRVPADMSR